MPNIQVNTSKYGPLFDGRALAELNQFEHEAVRTVAEQGYADIHHALDLTLRDPTPYYETQIQVERVTDEFYRVHDNGVIYGAWLEGVGSRNKTTRFKGYANWRRVGQALEDKAPKIAAQILSRYIERMN